MWLLFYEFSWVGVGYVGMMILAHGWIDVVGLLRMICFAEFHSNYNNEWITKIEIVL